VAGAQPWRLRWATGSCRCEFGPPASEPGFAEAIPNDPYELLGITYGATADEITRAYRAQLMRYHPDRVAGLGEELQRLAHERTIAIQRAYAALRES